MKLLPSSLQFAPEIVLVNLHYCIHQARLTEFNSYGFKASFNPTHPGKPGNPHGWWVSPWHYGLNQGPIVLMIENHRTSPIVAIDSELSIRHFRFTTSGFSRGVVIVLN